MEKPRTLRFSGDSFGNLDLSNAPPGMESEVAVHSPDGTKHPRYEKMKSKSNTVVVYGAEDHSDNNTAVGVMSSESLQESGAENKNDGADMEKNLSADYSPPLHNDNTSLELSVTNDADIEHTRQEDRVINDKGGENDEDMVCKNDDVPQAGDGVPQVEDGVPQVEDDVTEIADEHDIDDTDHQYDNEDDGPVQPGSDNDENSLHGPVMDNESKLENEVDKEDRDEENGGIEDGEYIGNDNDEDGDHEGLSESDDNDEEDNRSGAWSPTRPQTRSTLREVPGGMRAKANTPASQYTVTVEPLDSPVTPKPCQGDTLRGLSRGSRDEVFQRAMTLMSNRCTSAREANEELFSSREPPFGVHIPHYFYVQQSKPAPMSPLKAWRGYKGNVYFEPISVNRIQSAKDGRMTRESTRMSATLSSAMSQKHGAGGLVSGQISSEASRGTTPATRATTAGTLGQGGHRPYRFIEPPPSAKPQVFVMDKQAVLNSLRNKNSAIASASKDIHRDLEYIEGLESTGSLAVRPLSGNFFGGIGVTVISNVNHPGKLNQKKKLLFKRDRLCKGPNFSAVERRNKEALVTATQENTTGNAGSENSRKGSLHSNTVKGSRSSSLISAYRPGSRSAGPRMRHRGSAAYPTGEPNLVVSGDKFAPPTVMSPILRSNGPVFSLNIGGTDGENTEGQRAAANSPDLLDARGMMSAMTMASSPDHLRVNLPHHTDSYYTDQGLSDGLKGVSNRNWASGKGRRADQKPTTCSEELKPFIKYSHEVRVQYGQNTVNYC